MEDELRFQNMIMSKVVAHLPGASYFKRPTANRNIEEEEAFLSQLESLVRDFEDQKATPASLTTACEKKSLEDY